eukprot:3396832-Rhodomonas_salina.1
MQGGGWASGRSKREEAQGLRKKAQGLREEVEGLRADLFSAQQLPFVPCLRFRRRAGTSE